MRRIVLVAIFIGTAFLAAPSAGMARDAGINADRATDLSAAKKKKQASKQTKRQHVRVYPYAQPQRRPWADPSFDEYGRPYRSPYPPNTCVTDLGYGRFEPCDNAF